MIADAPVAQRIEHRIPNPGAAGSTPARRIFLRVYDDKISFMAYSFFSLLAACIAGPYPLSDYMAAFPSFPADRHYCKSRLRSS